MPVFISARSTVKARLCAALRAQDNLVEPRKLTARFCNGESATFEDGSAARWGV